MKKTVLGILAALLLSSPASAAGQKESAFDRVIRTGTIRCGYWVDPPMIVRDPNTGAMSGMFVDYVEALGKALSLKIVWAGEINLGTYLQDLNQGKFDAECATGWPNALRGKQVEYTNPVGYLPFFVYVKAGNTKFDHNLKALDNPSVRFSGHDGGTNSLAQQKFFPHSKLITIPGDAPQSESLDMVKFGKADATLITSFEGDNYMKSNPGTIRRVEVSPLRVIPIDISIPAYEFRFLNMLNTATNELLYDGTIDGLYAKYGIGPQTLFRVAKPYEMPK